MSRKTITVPVGTSAREALQQARLATGFEPAPSARRKAGPLGREPRPTGDTGQELADKAEELFDRDTRPDEPGTPAPGPLPPTPPEERIRDFKKPVDQAEAQRLFEKAVLEGSLPKGAVRAVAHKNGRVVAVNAKGQIVPGGELRAAPRTGRGKIASAEKIERAERRREERKARGEAGAVPAAQSLEQVAVRRIVSMSKSWFQSSAGGASPARLQAVWKGYKASKEKKGEKVRGRLVVDGDNVRIVSGKRVLGKTKLSNPGQWHEEES